MDQSAENYEFWKFIVKNGFQHKIRAGRVLILWRWQFYDVIYCAFCKLNV